MQRRIVVLGMHRSGTSAITRILNLLGVPLCLDEDLMEERHGNPAGHWESASLCDFNDRILGICGGSWDLPPRLVPGWEESPEVRALEADARATFNAAYPTEEWVWKDPRTCLTLPFWKPIIRPTVALIATRDPGSVAASLKHRSNIPTAVGLALWERCTRSALLGAEGLPAVIVRYEDMTYDPEYGVTNLRHEFAKIGIDLVGEDEDAVGSIRRDLQHHDGQRTRLSRRQENLLAITERLPSSSACFEPPTLPKERQWMPQGLTMARLVGSLER